MAFMVPTAQRLTFKRDAFQVNYGHRCAECNKTLDPGALGVYLCEGDPVCGECFVDGWYGRLSAPGYLDATDWNGPFATSDAALAGVCEMYDCDENGDPLDDCEE